MNRKALTALALTAAVVLATAGCTDDTPVATPTVVPPTSAAPRTLTAPLTVQTANGTGCPAGTVTTGVTATEVTADYTAFSVTAGGTGFRKACQLNIAVHSDAGKQAQVTSAHHEGVAVLPTGTSGTVKTTFYVTAGQTLAAPSSSLTAPTWSVDQTLPSGAVLTPCGTDVALNVRTDLTVLGAGTSATAAKSVISFQWSDC
jgi:hypothetical protein